jgi:carbon starvation protein
MSLPLLALGTLALLALGYALYGRLVARYLRPDPARTTPAERFRDGADFVPTRPFYLMSQHFSAIAAAGPIAGPILACSIFGWVPCLLWIGLGVVFIGAVHDFTALFASVRHDARSVAEIVRQHVGRRAWLAVLAFIWLALVYVIVAFTDITAQTFVGKTEDFEGGSWLFNPGGAVALASALYLGLAVLLGVLQRVRPLPLWLVTVLFVPATLGAVQFGTLGSTALVFSARTWALVILGYCFVASLVPVWLLLQPRGYLGGFVLYLALAVGTVGVLFGGYEIRQPAFRPAPLVALDGQAVFPFLFVTIACGACSGFHGLVCSGTTSKQVARETHCRPIGYGAMLLEGFVALIALSTVLIVANVSEPPGRVYGNGLGEYLTLLIGRENLRFAATFGAMAFSTFVFDTLDVSVRLGRYILQELFGARGRVAAVLATALTVGAPAALLAASGSGAYLRFWQLFGTSNQLLAALTLLAVTVWLKRSGRKAWFTLWPTLFVGCVTVWALLLQARTAWLKCRDPLTGDLMGVPIANVTISLALVALALWVALESARALVRSRGAAAPRTVDTGPPG